MSTQFPGDPSHDPLAARLRAALNAEADMVQPGDDGLEKIRDGVAGSGRPWWRHPAAPAAAAAVVLGLMAGGFALLAGGDGGNDDGVVATGRTTTAPATTTPSPSETPSPTPSATDSALPATDVFVYFMRDDGAAVRLYREVHQVPKGTEDAKAAAALRAMFEQKPQDPDYVSVWPLGTEVRDYSVSGDVATVDLTDWAAGCACVEDEAVQQLVYTVTANEPSVTKVLLRVNGKVPTSKAKNDWTKPVERAPMVDVQGLIWLLSPSEGQSVSSPVTISGYGTAFEGTISWEVRADGGNGPKVAEGHTQGGSMGEFAEFTDTVTLDPGTYEISAFESSAESGRPIHVDTKVFSVR